MIRLLLVLVAVLAACASPGFAQERAPILNDVPSVEKDIAIGTDQLAVDAIQPHFAKEPTLGSKFDAQPASASAGGCAAEGNCGVVRERRVFRFGRCGVVRERVRSVGACVCDGCRRVLSAVPKLRLRGRCGC